MFWLYAFLFLVILPLISYIVWKLVWGPVSPSFPKVLAYHKVTGFEFGGTWMTKKRFISSLDYLLDSGFCFITEDLFLDTVSGKRIGSGREILMTFDDGYRMIIESALPALEERKIPALIFMVTAYAGRENRWELRLPGRRFGHMGWDEVRDLSARGFSFGSHSRTHCDLTRLEIGDLRSELYKSKEEIEKAINSPVRTVSYPFGRSNLSVRTEARAAGYEAAFTLYPSGKNNRLDPFDLRREGVWIIDTCGSLGNKLGQGKLFWAEDLKGRAINRVAGLTPFFKGKSSLDLRL
ncbi:MAG: polysaccharide deacetylase family protein [Candidatus Krumholzibacteriota bacterium]|nr:polysaccharide deacetylase family protein [Candidatus Krumholzibacteriota bacterium]